MEPRVEFDDRETSFAFRLVKGAEVSPWFPHYSGILKHTFSDGSTWYACTGYYDGTLPIEVPFQVVDTQTTIAARQRRHAALATLSEVARSMA